jgi:hypothetical protein
LPATITITEQDQPADDRDHRTSVGSVERCVGCADYARGDIGLIQDVGHLWSAVLADAGEDAVLPVGDEVPELLLGGRGQRESLVVWGADAGSASSSAPMPSIQTSLLIPVPA